MSNKKAHKFEALKSHIIKYGPGPGLYDPIMPKHAKGGKFLISSRITEDFKQKSGTPGPGAYNIPKVSHKKACTLGGRLFVDYSEDYPGPGTYQWDIKNTQISPAMKISKRFRKDDKDYLPGPGAYTIDDPNYIRNRRVNMFVKAPRAASEAIRKGSTIKGRYTEKEIDNGPGPGQYSGQYKIVNGVKFSQGVRGLITCNRDTSPGPGSYRIRDPRKNGCSFGSGRRTAFEVRDGPGPGEYNNRRDLGRSPKYFPNPSGAYSYL